ncbi:MAG: cation:proton antiporter, partial [Gammaproteobacteria bacterium]|nr:cation:proton antiporter [Gammaproteobacteria bacterium]
LLLFIIGLELQPSRLWVLRRSVFGMGTAQVLLSAAVLAGICFSTGLSTEAAIITGLGLSLSSTAFVLQMLAEKKQLTAAHGRAGFSILLFQDLAVIPMLALLPLLAVDQAATNTDSLLVSSLKAFAAVAALIVGGRLLLRPVFRITATSGSHEIFAASALLVVIGSALLMEFAGLSMALGAFLAGVLLADSEYRHELEANIEPFKGLLLGLFFIAVGMSANLGLLASQPMQVVGLTAALLFAKWLVLYVLGRLFGLGGGTSRNLAFVLPQGGEFAFVLFGAAVTYQLLSTELADMLIMIVTLSMAVTPLLVTFNEKILAPRLDEAAQKPYDDIEESANPVIIAGFGRVGQITGRLLRVQKIPFTALEKSQGQVEIVRRFGNKVYYGDASKLELLRAAQADKAKVFVLAVDDIEASTKIAELIHRHFPNLTVCARARNRRHAHLLMENGVKYFMRETFASSLELAEQVLHKIYPNDPERASRAVAQFRRHDEQTLEKQFAFYQDEEKLVQSAKDAAAELTLLFESDESERRSND